MGRSTGRRPVSNFFIKKALQVGLVARVTLAAVVATLISAATILAVYYIQHRSVLLYQLEETGNLSKESIFDLLLPSIVISITVNVLLALCIGLYASRKYAVPVYKLEQWARLLRSGKLNATLRFRERKDMAELSDQFNSLASDLRGKFSEIKKLLVHLKNTDQNDEQVQRVDEMLSSLDLASGSSEKRLDATGLITEG